MIVTKIPKRYALFRLTDGIVGQRPTGNPAPGPGPVIFDKATVPGPFETMDTYVSDDGMTAFEFPAMTWGDAPNTTYRNAETLIINTAGEAYVQILPASEALQGGWGRCYANRQPLNALSKLPGLGIVYREENGVLYFGKTFELREVL